MQPFKNAFVLTKGLAIKTYYLHRIQFVRTQLFCNNKVWLVSGSGSVLR
jgi:hypothetical protein